MNIIRAAVSVTTSLALLAFAAATPAAGTGDAAAQRQVVLHYDRSGLTSQAAVEHAYERMSQAAEQVCQPYAGRELSRQRVYQRCLDVTLAAAVASVQDPRLSAVYDRARGTARPIRTAQR